MAAGQVVIRRDHAGDRVVLVRTAWRRAALWGSTSKSMGWKCAKACQRRMVVDCEESYSRELWILK